MKTQIQAPVPETPFKSRLRVLILEKIKEWRKDGTTSASVDCLMQCVAPPQLSYPGAPQGTNARCFYAQLFQELCSEQPIKRFML